MKPLTFRLTRYPSGARQAPHAHEELHLSLVLRGAVTESIGGVTEFAAPLSVVAKDPGVKHANVWGDDGAVLAQLSIHGESLKGIAGSPRVDRPWAWTHDMAVAAPFLRIVSRARRPNFSFSTDDADVSDLVAALTWTDSSTRGAPPAWLREVVGMMRDTWQPGLTVAHVARRADVHPVYLARCVRRWYGTSIGRELRRIRLRHAARTLAEATRSVSHVAHESGFADEPHLCRSLREVSSFTPARLREIVHQAAALAHPARHS